MVVSQSGRRPIGRRVLFPGSEDPGSHASGGSGSEDPRTQFVAAFPLLFALAAGPTFAQSAPAGQCVPEGANPPMPKSARAYAAMCEPRLGVAPTVDCGQGARIRIRQDGREIFENPGLHACNDGSLQIGDCMPGSSLQRYEGRNADGTPRPEVVWVSFCRHDGRDDVFNVDIPDSVQMIGYNSETGATCFFESGDNSPWHPGIATPEWIDATNIRLAIFPAAFHDGSIVTAHDLVFTYNRIGGIAEYHQGGATTDHPGGWSSARAGRGAGDWVRNEAVDDRTWAIEIGGADAGFLTVRMDGTSEVVIMSQADTEARGDLAVDNDPMGTGPMRFVSHTDDEDFVFERFDNHFRGIDYPVRLPHVTHFKKMTGLVRPELQARLAALETGEIDIVGGEGLGPKAAQPFLDDPDFTVQFQAGLGWTMFNIWPNLYQETMEDGSPNPFLDLRVRQAANHAINRQSIIDNLLLGVGEQSLLVYSGVPGYPSAEQKREVLFEYDVEKAKALLAEAGYPDGFDIKLFFSPDWGGELTTDIALVTAQDLTAAGIRIELISVVGPEFWGEPTSWAAA